MIADGVHRCVYVSTIAELPAGVAELASSLNDNIEPHPWDLAVPEPSMLDRILAIRPRRAD